MKGVHNKFLKVNLGTLSVEDLPVDDGHFRLFLGGRGLALKFFIDHSIPNADPLSGENPIVFAVGPLTSTIVPTSGRTALVTKSPLSGAILYSTTGGFFGQQLKNNGYDGILIEGAASDPVYLVIDGRDGCRIESAADLWGLDTRQTMEKLKEKEGNDIRALMVGPAGENLVLISSIMNDGDHRAFGRGGSGAVMGSKKLKAIVVKRNNIRAEIADAKMLQTYVKSAIDKINLVPITRASLPLFGTSALVNYINQLNMLPTRNFQTGYDERAENISGEAIRKKILVRDEACYACPIRCGRMTKVGDMEGKGPEYESVILLGSNTGIFDLEKVTRANYLCNLYGLDTISTGGTISCAMELAERGIIENKDLRFGNADILEPLIKEIAYKKGLGAELAEGSRRLAEKYGHPEYSMSVKGLELPAYDPRGAKGHALGYATANRGGDHLTGYLAAMELFSAPKMIPRHTTAGKADLLVLKQHQKAVEDSLVVCTFAGWALDLDFYSRFMHVVTGEEFNVSYLLEIGERIYNLERLFNIREGLTRADDILPKRFLEETLSDGPVENAPVPLEQMLDDYYYVRKWDKNGVPTRAKLEKLGLEPLEGVEVK